LTNWTDVDLNMRVLLYAFDKMESELFEIKKELRVLRDKE